ncbi:tyrosine-type recombinase/integrase [Helicobacter salomonis]|uniref:tyrosine-type recombinase/integrase n=1 Tax=Helicobacter salomonis TaxID=56878 RepID=UPI000CF0D53F|nr:site-specific integrase [Helicobacter salomonis]
MRYYPRNGMLYAEVYEQGKRKRFSLKMPDTPENRAKVQAQIKYANSPSVCVVAEEYLHRYKLGLKPSSQRTIKSRLNTILDLISGGNTQMPIAQINKQTIQAFYNQLADNPPSQDHVKNLTHLLKRLLDFALEMDYIGANPFFKQRLAMARPPKEKQPLNLEEVSDMLEVCSDLRLKTYLAVAFFTGARVGEIQALKWSDVNFAKNTIRIERTLSQKNELGTPKTRSSVRTLEMLPIVKQALLRYLEQAPSSPYIFTQERYLNLAKPWRELLEQLHLSVRKLYSTRHTFASLMLSGGANALRISKMLGHANAHITLSVYAQYLPQEHTPLAPFLDNAPLQRSFS